MIDCGERDYFARIVFSIRCGGVCMKEKAAFRTGDFEDERLRIVDEYASGSYLKTSADLAMEEEKMQERDESTDDEQGAESR